MRFCFYRACADGKQKAILDTMSQMPSVQLKPKEDTRIRGGHPWIYDNEIAAINGNPSSGSEVVVRDSRGKQLGYAFFNSASKIQARIFSRTSSRADTAFFIQAFQESLAWRARFINLEKESFRAVFGEADSVPGLIVDLFNGETASDGRKGRWLSAQFLSLGVDQRKSNIIEALQKVFEPDGIMERSDAPVRKLEGLEDSTGILSGCVPDSIVIEENGLAFSVDLLGGQKTGWFLDQRANRAAAARYAKGRQVADIFCNQGGFGILCAAKGAASVVCVDSSNEALKAVQENADRNACADRVTTLLANAFDQLRTFEKEGRKFGMVILDPPAFAKSRSSIPQAYRGYKEINVRALRLLNKGGILVTCSCSHWFDDVLFDKMLLEAAFDCGKRFRTIEERSQDLDHPIVSGYQESRYLKVRIVEVL